MSQTGTNRRAWTWVPLLYFTEGLPYVIVMSVSVIMYKNLGISNTNIGIYTSLLYLPWVVKPLWSPVVDLFSTKRKWFLSMQVLIGLAFLGVGFSLPTSHFFVMSLACFWMAAFASATNDIASDGYYMIGLTEGQQSFFLGVRSTFYRLANITGQGLIVIVAGMLEFHYADNAKAWSITMILVAVLMLALAAANYVASPRTELSPAAQGENRQNFFTIIASFFQKKKIWVAVGFILTYRLGEAQLVKMASPFLLDTSDKGGLALTTSQVGTIYGAIGVVALVIGGILGGIAISRHGLGRWMLPMMLALNLPNLLYVGLAWVQPTHLWVATGVVFLEQFGYGFGFAAYLMYLIYVADGPTKTSHYALATGLMALGMMLPGMLSGFIQEHLGYTQFFIWVVVSALPAFVLLRHLDFPAEFGKKKE
jgi:MFS transporter, PAT family, beta-lactamase induction signal transducer AmpG